MLINDNDITCGTYVEMLKAAALREHKFQWQSQGVVWIHQPSSQSKWQSRGDRELDAEDRVTIE